MSLQSSRIRLGNGGAGRWLVAMVLAYTVLTLVYTWPGPARLGHTLIGHLRDGGMFLWNTWWTARAIGRGENPLWTNLLFYPEGVSRVIDTHCLLPGLLAAPLVKLFGLIPAYDLIILMTFVLSGVGAALLADELFHDRAAAFVAGTLFAFGHVRVSMVVYLNLVQTQWMVFAVWATLRAVRRRSVRSGILSGVFLAALLYSSYNLLFLTLLFLALVVPALLVAALLGRNPIRPRMVPLAVAAVVALALSAPLLAAVTKELPGVEGVYGLARMENSNSYHEAVPLVRYFVRAVQWGAEWPPREASYLGVVGIGLGVLGIVFGRRRRVVWFLLVTTLLFFLLSLGPRLNLNGDTLGSQSLLPFPLPFYYISRWPLFEQVRVAHRYALVGWIAWSALGGFGAAGLLGLCRRRWPVRKWLPPAAAALLALAALADFGEWPFPQLYRVPDPPPELALVAADPRNCAVFEFPAGRWGDPAFSWYQTRLGKPVYLEGEVARIPHSLRLRRHLSPLRREFDRAFREERVPTERVPALREVLDGEVRRNRIGWVILSWGDWETLNTRRRAVRWERLESMDRFVRTLLPVDEVVYFRDPDDLEAWNARRGKSRLSESSLFAIYRLDCEGSNRP